MQNDRLKYMANVIGLAVLSFVLTGGLLNEALSLFMRKNIAGASLANPIGFSEILLQIIYFVRSIITLAIPILVLRRGDLVKKRTFATKQKPEQNAKLLALIFLGMIPLTNLLSGVFERAFTGLFHMEATASIALPDGFLATILLFITMCVVPAVLEEILFRGYIQRMLLPYGGVFSLLVTSLLFTLMHARIYQMPSIFLLSMALGYVFYVTEDIRISMSLHFLNNAIAFIIAYVAQNMDGASAMVFTTMLFAICLFAGAIGLALLKKEEWKQLPPNKRPDRISRIEKLLTAPFFSVALIVLLISFFTR